SPAKDERSAPSAHSLHAKADHRSSTAVPSPSPPRSAPGPTTPERQCQSLLALQSADRYYPQPSGSPCCDDRWNPPYSSGAQTSSQDQTASPPHARGVIPGPGQDRRRTVVLPTHVGVIRVHYG